MKARSKPMALIICPECKQSISDQAASCSKCGYPVPGQPKAANIRNIPINENPIRDNAQVTSHSSAEKSEESVIQNWAKAVVALYALILVVLTVPVLMFSWHDVKIHNASKVYGFWGYWILMGLLMMSQFVLLKMPVCFASRRPVTRRSLWLPVIVSGLLMGLVVMCFATTLIETFAPKGPGFLGVIALLLLPATWIYWAFVFFRLSQTDDPIKVDAKQNQWLLRGSALEFLIAVPTHIVARNRHDCCAGFGTFLGLVTGLSVMLLAFGPSVFFLFLARWRRLHPNGNTNNFVSK